MINYWRGPRIIDGEESLFPLRNHDIIPFRKVDPPPCSSETQPAAPPLPSAHLLHVREILVQIAHMMGAGECEDSELDDDSTLDDSMIHPLSNDDWPTAVDHHELMVPPGKHQRPSAALEPRVMGTIDDWLKEISRGSDDCGDNLGPEAEAGAP
jgi:hypothetical protein